LFHLAAPRQDRKICSTSANFARVTSDVHAHYGRFFESSASERLFVDPDGRLLLLLCSLSSICWHLNVGPSLEALA
jgi:hypothetical protein